VAAKKRVIVEEEIGDVEEITTGQQLTEHRQKNFQSRNGAKLEGTPKPQGALRRLVNAPPKTNRPVNIYKERVVDVDSGVMKYCLWWTTEQSDVEGKEIIVKYNPRTEEETPIGEDFTIPFTVEKAKELIKKSFGGTSIYRKDGEQTLVVRANDVEELFYKDVEMGITPKTK